MSLSNRLAEMLREIDLRQVAVSAQLLGESGELDQVGEAVSKMLAAKDAALIAGIRYVCFASKQDNVSEGFLGEGGMGSLTVIKADNLEALIEKLYQQTGPRAAVRREEAGRHAKMVFLSDLGMADRVEWQWHYQPLKLRYRLSRGDRNRDKGSEQDGMSLPPSPQRWEEVVRRSQERYSQPWPLDEILSRDYQHIVGSDSAGVPRFVVLGPPGSGKTTLSCHIARLVSSSDWPQLHCPLLPACVPLREWAAHHGQLDLEGYLAWRHSNSFTSEPEEGWETLWKEWLSRGDALLLIDGLDEVEPQGSITKSLRNALDRYPDCPAVLTCRSLSFEQYQVMCSGFDVFQISELDGKTQRELLDAFPNRAFDPYQLLREIARHHLKDLAANPLLLTILGLVFNESSRTDGAPLPRTRGELLERAIDLFLTWKGKEKGRLPDLVHWPVANLRRLLEEAAFWLLLGSHERLSFQTSKLDTALQAAVTALEEEGLNLGLSNPGQRGALREDLIGKSGILRSDGANCCFLHKLLQEFLAASALKAWIDKVGFDGKLSPSFLNGTEAGAGCTVKHLLQRKAWDSGWQEVICLLAGRLDDPRGLLRLLNVEKKDDDLSRHRLALLIRCLAEVPRKEPSPIQDLIKSVTETACKLRPQHEYRGTLDVITDLDRVLPLLARLNGCEPSGAESAEGEMRDSPARPLLRMPTPADEVNNLSSLLVMLENADEHQRRRAVEAVERLGSAAAERSFLEGLSALLRHPDKGRCRTAVEAVGRIGPTAAELLPTILDNLLPLLNGMDKDLCWVAVETMGRLGPTAADRPGILKSVLDLLESPEGALRQVAAGAVARFNLHGLRLLREGEAWQALSLKKLTRLD